MLSDRSMTAGAVCVSTKTASFDMNVTGKVGKYIQFFVAKSGKRLHRCAH